jgi:predicted RecA/RadA family phage recombinase
MGLFDSIFGSSKKETVTENSTKVDNPWAQQIPYLTQAFSGASDAYNKSLSGMPQNFVAGMTPEQQTLFNKMYGYGTAQTPAVTATAAGGLFGQGLGAFGSGIQGLQNWAPSGFTSILADAHAAANDPSVQGMIDAATRDARYAAGEGLRQNDQISAGNGTINGSRAGIRDAMIQSRLADTVADTSANIRGDVYGRGLQTALQHAMAGDQSRLAQYNQMLTGGLGGATTGINAGNAAIDQQRGLFDIANSGATGLQTGNQLALNNDIAKWQSLFSPVQNFYGIVGANDWGGTTNATGTKTGTTTSSPSLFDAAGSMVGAASKFLPFLMSDRRLKEDAHVVGRLNDGTPVWSFRYKGDETTHLGLMADEVEQRYPEAVHEIGGYKAVDYRQATLESRRG